MRNQVLKLEVKKSSDVVLEEKVDRIDITVNQIQSDIQFIKQLLVNQK